MPFGRCLGRRTEQRCMERHRCIWSERRGHESKGIQRQFPVDHVVRSHRAVVSRSHGREDEGMAGHDHDPDVWVVRGHQPEVLGPGGPDQAVHHGQRRDRLPLHHAGPPLSHERGSDLPGAVPGKRVSEGDVSAGTGRPAALGARQDHRRRDVPPQQRDQAQHDRHARRLHQRRRRVERRPPGAYGYDPLARRCAGGDECGWIGLSRGQQSGEDPADPLDRARDAASRPGLPRRADSHLQPVDAVNPYYFWNCTAFPAKSGTRSSIR